MQEGVFEVSLCLNSNQSLLQFSPVAHWFLVHVLHHATPDYIINGILVWTARRYVTTPVEWIWRIFAGTRVSNVRGSGSAVLREDAHLSWQLRCPLPWKPRSWYSTHITHLMHNRCRWTLWKII